MSHTWLWCIGGPALERCHSGPMFLLRPRLWRLGWGCLKEPIGCRFRKQLKMAVDLSTPLHTQTHSGVHFHSIKFIRLSSQARSSVSVIVQKLQQHSDHISRRTLAKYTVVHLVSFGSCYSSQAPSWRTTDASAAVRFFHIKPRSQPKRLTVSSVCACVCVCLEERSRRGLQKAVNLHAVTPGHS